MTQATEHWPKVVTFAFEAVDITALTWGDPGNPAVIALHGFPDSAWTWDRLGPTLAARGHYVVAPFLRGYAPSSLARDDDYSLASLVGDVLDLHRAIHADHRTVLIGHDWGGAIVSAASSCVPEKFSRTVLIAIPPLAAITSLLTRWRPPRVQLPILARQLPRSWYMAVVSTPWLAERLGPALPRLLWRLWAPGEDVAKYRQLGLTALSGLPHRRAAYSYYRAVWNPLYRRAGISAPRQRKAFGPMRNTTLYVQGRDDTCGLEATGARAPEVLPPGSVRTIVPNAGHFAHLEQPDVIARHIIDFIQSGEDL